MIAKKNMRFKPGTLIHDKALTAIRRSGKKPIVRRLDDNEEFYTALCKKLLDDVAEYMQDFNDRKKLIDALQVLYFIGEEVFGYTRADMDYYVSDGVETFDERLYLEAIEEPEKKVV